MLLKFQRDFASAIGVPAEGAMRVYRNTMIGGCVDALRANYPIVARLLGEEMFEAVAADHAAMCPPGTPILALYGDRFPDWLQEQAWVREFPYVPDVARIDRLYVESLFAADAEPMEMDAIGGRDDWLEMRLALHPATRFTWLSTPSMSIWLAQREEVEGELEPDWHAEGVLLTRPALAVQPLRLDAAGHRFLSGIRLGDTVGDAAITTVSIYPETDIGSLFTSLVNAGAFAASSNRSLP